MAKSDDKGLILCNVNMKNILKTLYSELIPNYLLSIVFYPSIHARILAHLPLSKGFVISEILKLVALNSK